MSADRAAAIADLEMVVSNLQDVMQKLLVECQEHGGEFTPRQEGKWEGAFLMVRGVLSDELHPMLKAWQQGGSFSRKGEEILAAGGGS